jgi:hypothetical protein
MLKTIIASAIALVLMAGAATVWTSSGKVEASTPPAAPPAATKGDRLDIRPSGGDCSQQTWPYYEAKCLRERKHPTGQARDVRLVALSQSIG